MQVIVYLKNDLYFILFQMPGHNSCTLHFRFYSLRGAEDSCQRLTCDFWTIFPVEHTIGCKPSI